MELRLSVRRFFCGNETCAKVTFAERFAGLTAPRAQRTDRLRASLEAIGLALAGRAGSRLAQRLGVRIGYTSLLRPIRALPEPQVDTVPVLGVDDFAFRRGHTYGTILIDMATRRPIDLLPGRDPAPLRAWLETHPGVEIVCRDRSSSYGEAVRTAAPDAIQVADRFHLWANLTGAIEACILHHRSALTEPIVLPEPGSTAEPDPVPQRGRDTGAEPTGKMAERHRARFKVVQDLLAEGHGLRTIARHPDHLSEEERLKFKILLNRSQPLEEVYDLVKSFAAMMGELDGHRPPAWIAAAQASEHPSLRRFANGLGKDLDAVTAGLTLPHSSGAVEGNVNRLKKIKRILYGRANLDLLRKLVLLSD